MMPVTDKIRKKTNYDPDIPMLSWAFPTTFPYISQIHRGSFEPRGSNCFSSVWDTIASRGGGGSIPIFLRKHISTCDFPGVGVRTPAPSGSGCSLLITRTVSSPLSYFYKKQPVIPND